MQTFLFNNFWDINLSDFTTFIIVIIKSRVRQILYFIYQNVKNFKILIILFLLVQTDYHLQICNK